MNNINIGSVRRQGVITFDNGVKLKTEFYLTSKKLASIFDYEKCLVESMNKKQPYMVNKISNCSKLIL